MKYRQAEPVKQRQLFRFKTSWMSHIKALCTQSSSRFVKDVLTEEEQGLSLLVAVGVGAVAVEITAPMHPYCLELSQKRLSTHQSLHRGKKPVRKP